MCHTIEEIQARFMKNPTRDNYQWLERACKFYYPTTWEYHLRILTS